MLAKAPKLRDRIRHKTQAQIHYELLRSCFHKIRLFTQLMKRKKLLKRMQRKFIRVKYKSIAFHHWRHLFVARRKIVQRFSMTLNKHMRASKAYFMASLKRLMNNVYYSKYVIARELFEF